MCRDGSAELRNVWSINHIDVASSKRTCFTHYMGTKIGYISQLYKLKMLDIYTKC